MSLNVVVFTKTSHRKINSFVFHFIIFLMTITLMGCRQKQNNVTIRVNAIGAAGKYILIGYSNMLNFQTDTLAFSKLDSNGKAIVEIKVPQISFAFFQIGEKVGSLCISPDDDFEIMVDYRDSNAIPKISGKGSEAANYLTKVLTISQNLSKHDGKYIFELNVQDFLKQVDSMSKEYSQFHNAYIDSVKLSEKLQYVLLKRNEMEVLYRRQNYVMSHYNDSVSILQTPNQLKDINNKVPFDAELLNARCDEYAQVLNFYFFSLVSRLAMEKPKRESQNMTEQVTALIHETIKKGHYDNLIKELLLAKNIDKALANEGITPLVDKMFQDFKQDFSQSPYSNLINDRYKKWLMLSKGNPAPDFTGISLDGNPISLSDLKGKIVYVDVWATWCGPCIAEFPYSKKIRQQFEKNPEIVFMYVSVDSDTKTWRSFIQKEPNFKGLHLNLNDEQSDFLTKAYQMWGIPQFMLIDQQGKIVSVKAPSPSSGKLEEEIRKLLKPKHE